MVRTPRWCSGVRVERLCLNVVRVWRLATLVDDCLSNVLFWWGNHNGGRWSPFTSPLFVFSVFPSGFIFCVLCCPLGISSVWFGGAFPQKAACFSVQLPIGRAEPPLKKCSWGTASLLRPQWHKLFCSGSRVYMCMVSPSPKPLLHVRPGPPVSTHYSRHLSWLLLNNPVLTWSWAQKLVSSDWF